jgi:hypothetical protein
MSAPVKGSDALPAEGTVVVPRTVGEAIEKLTVTVWDDVAPASTRLWAPAGRFVGTVKA